MGLGVCSNLAVSGCLRQEAAEMAGGPRDGLGTDSRRCVRVLPGEESHENAVEG